MRNIQCYLADTMKLHFCRHIVSLQYNHSVLILCVQSLIRRDVSSSRALWGSHGGQMINSEDPLVFLIWKSHSWGASQSAP